MKKPLILAENKELLDKVKFRTKFEVAHAVWNPKISLLALGSLDGEVVVKRYLWKTGWKKNFARDNSANEFNVQVDASSSESSSTKAKDQLLRLCWSPDGQVLLAVFQSGFCYYLDTQTGDTLFVTKLAYAPFCVQWLKFWPKKPLKFPRIGDQALPASILSANLDGSGGAKNGGPPSVCCAVAHFYRHIVHKSLSASFLCLLHTNDNSSQTFVDIFAGGILLIRRLAINNGVTVHPLMNRQNDFFVHNDRIHILSKDIESTSFDIVQVPDEIGQEHLLVYDQIVDCFCLMAFCCICLQNQSSSSGGASSTAVDDKSAAQSSAAAGGVPSGAAVGRLSFVRPLRHSVRSLRSLLVKLAELNAGRERATNAERLLDTLLKIGSAQHCCFDDYELLLDGDKNCQQKLDVHECVRYYRTLSTDGIHTKVKPFMDQTECIVLATDAKEAVMQQIGDTLQNGAENSRRHSSSSSTTSSSSSSSEEEEESGGGLFANEKSDGDDNENANGNGTGGGGGGGEGHRGGETEDDEDDETRSLSLHSFIFGHCVVQQQQQQQPQQKASNDEEGMECE